LQLQFQLKQSRDKEYVYTLILFFPLKYFLISPSTISFESIPSPVTIGLVYKPANKAAAPVSYCMI
jgi:hypothetical protein